MIYKIPMFKFHTFPGTFIENSKYRFSNSILPNHTYKLNVMYYVHMYVYLYIYKNSKIDRSMETHIQFGFFCENIAPWKMYLLNKDDRTSQWKEPTYEMWWLLQIWVEKIQALSHKASVRYADYRDALIE